MASTTAMAAAAAHSMPPFPMPKMPRIRPPPIPKGTTGPNTLLPTTRGRGRVWADGKWRDPASNSAKHRQQVVALQLQKALQAKDHGTNIYAFKNMYNHQVIYSLSRTIDDKKLLEQFVYLGKKSIPETIRPDMWRPYFSVHFAQTQAGAAQGLRVYHEIREMSLKHQLEAPDVVTHKSRAIFKAVPGEEEGAKYTTADGQHIHYEKTMAYTRKYSAVERKERILNQASSSVAILAAVLNHHDQRKLSPVQSLIKQAKRKEQIQLTLSARAASRLARIRVQEAETLAKQETLREGKHLRLGQSNLKEPAISQAGLEGRGYNKLIKLWDKQIKERYEAAKQQSLVPDAAYDQALAVFEAGRQQLIFRVIEATKREVDAKLDALPAEEKAQILKDMEAERVTVSEELDKLYDAKVSNFGTKVWHNSPSQKKLHVKQLSDMRRDHARRKAFVGPYQLVQQRIDEMAKQYDQMGVEAAKQLKATRRQAVKDEKADPYGGREVKVYWADLTDGLRAKEWPGTVAHFQLQEPKQHIQTNKIGNLDTESSPPKSRLEKLGSWADIIEERAVRVQDFHAAKLQALPQFIKTSQWRNLPELYRSMTTDELKMSLGLVKSALHTLTKDNPAELQAATYGSTTPIEHPWAGYAHPEGDWKLTLKELEFARAQTKERLHARITL